MGRGTLHKKLDCPVGKCPFSAELCPLKRSATRFFVYNLFCRWQARRRRGDIIVSPS